MITRIYHKKNELFQTEFYRDKQCQQAFDYEENVYIELKDGDITPLVNICNFDITQPSRDMITIYTPYLDTSFIGGILGEYCFITTIDDITINLSKYISEDNAVLFLSKKEVDRYSYDCEAWFLYQKDFPVRLSNSEMDIRDWKAITIFLTHGTESELKKANELAHELKEKYGIKEVNLFILHCYVNLRPCWLPQISYQDGVLTFHFFNILKYSKQEKILAWEENQEELENDYYLVFDTITTTNSTKIAYITEDCPRELENKFKILDCYDIFNDYLKKIK